MQTHTAGPFYIAQRALGPSRKLSFANPRAAADRSTEAARSLPPEPRAVTRDRLGIDLSRGPYNRHPDRSFEVPWTPIERSASVQLSPRINAPCLPSCLFRFRHLIHTRVYIYTLACVHVVMDTRVYRYMLHTASEISLQDRASRAPRTDRAACNSRILLTRCGSSIRRMHIIPCHIRPAMDTI